MGILYANISEVWGDVPKPKASVFEDVRLQLVSIYKQHGSEGIEAVLPPEMRRQMHPAQTDHLITCIGFAFILLVLFDGLIRRR